MRTIALAAAASLPLIFVWGPADAGAVTIPNILVNDVAADLTANDTQSTTALVVLPGGVVLCAFTDTGSLAAGNHVTGIARSTDGGETWLDQGILPNSTLGDGGFPVYARSAATGTVMLATGVFNAAGILAFRSTNAGVSYQSPVDPTAGATMPDHPWLACDNFAGAGNGNFYLLYRDFGGVQGMYFTRSTDDGATWSSRQALTAGTGQLAWVVVGADHAVYCFWLDNDFGENKFYMRKSTDRGLTFGPYVAVASLYTIGQNGDLGLNGGFRSWNNIQVVAHPTDANKLYAVWADLSSFFSTDKNVYISQSDNGGATWSTAWRLNTDATTNDQWRPVIAISPDGTRLFTSWYDRRLDVNNSLIDVYARLATISGGTVTFGANDLRITTTSFPVVRAQDPGINSVYMGDSDVAVADNTTFYRTWGDNRLASATHAKQPDVRLAKVPKGAVMKAGSAVLQAENCAPPNGAPDPNETVTMNFSLSNDGTGPTTNLVATLQSSGGVIARSGPQSYGALPSDGTYTSRPFTLQAVGACGGTVNAMLQLQDGATNLGTFSFPIKLGATLDYGATTYSSGDLTVTIPATGTSGDMADQILHVSDPGLVTDVNVRVRLNHTNDGDLKISLVSPTGTTVVLSDRRGAGGENFGVGPNRCNGGGTTFDDEATTPIASGSPAYTGSYVPDQPLSALDGIPAQGDWKLKINDGAAGNVGVLGCWSLEISRAQTTCSACSPTAVDDATPAGPFAVRQNEPNPFSGTTTIRYSIPHGGPVELVVFDVQGRRVATLVRETQSAGAHAVTFGPGALTATGKRLGALPSGAYFYRLRAGGRSTTGKMLLLR